MNQEGDTSDPNSAGLEDAIRALLAQGQMIQAIKLYREQTGAGLAEAKGAVERIECGESPAANHPAIDGELEKELLNLLLGDKKFEAIKLYRERTHQGLKEAKDAVEALAARNDMALSSRSGCFGLLILLLTVVLGLIGLLGPASARSANKAACQFRIRLSEAVARQPYTGRVYVFFSSEKSKEPRLDSKFIKAEPFIALDVENWQPGEIVTLSADQANLLSCPVPLAEMDLSRAWAQAVVRLNPFDPQVGSGEGNGYSTAIAIASVKNNDQPVDLVIDHVVPPHEFKESRWCKLLKVRSKLLSDFHGREVTINAAVILPKSYYDQPARRYPVIFDIPGFGGTHHRGMTDHPHEEHNERGVEFLRVMLDGMCPLGHHVFADSANNGPYGSALVEEFLPAFDQQFRSVPQPTARFLTGASSGAWSSLWVLIHHPDQFAGVWADSPDPVDFRDFQRIDLYAPGQNMYVDEQGQPRPLAHAEDRVLIYVKDFAGIERVQGHGGQLHSFEAVFSPRGSDGRPVPLWNWQTGAVNPEVPQLWEKYDIRLFLERNWRDLAPKLQGKLHIHTSESEVFYLEGAVKLLKQSLAKLGSDADIQIHPGHGHGAMSVPPNNQVLLREMVSTFLRHHPDQGAP